jgi:acyl carrier protein
MRSTSAQMGVMALDWRQLAEYIAALKVTARFAVVLAGTGDETGAGGSRGHLRDTLMRLPGDERPEAVLAFLREHAAKVLRTTPGALDPNRPLAELGLDSLMAVELGNRLESDLGVALPLGTLTAGSNLTGLVDLLLDVLQTSHAAVASGA